MVWYMGWPPGGAGVRFARACRDYPARHRLPALISEPQQVSRFGMASLQARDSPSWPRSPGGGRTAQGASGHSTAGGQGFSSFAGVWRPRRSPPPEDHFSVLTSGNSPPPVFGLGVWLTLPDGRWRLRRAGAPWRAAILIRSRPRPSCARGRKAGQASSANRTASSWAFGFLLENQTKAAKRAAASRGSIASLV